MNCAVDILVRINFGQGSFLWLTKDEHRFVPLSMERRVYFPFLWVSPGSGSAWTSGLGLGLGLTLRGQPPSPSFLWGHSHSEPIYLEEAEPQTKSVQRKASRATAQLPEGSVISQSHLWVLGDDLAQLSPQLIVALTSITLFGGMV